MMNLTTRKRISRLSRTRRHLG